MKQLFYISLFFLVSLEARAQQSYIDYVSPFHPVESSSGMVVSQNELSSKIGTEILNKGGNAVDAAVAVSLHNLNFVAPLHRGAVRLCRGPPAEAPPADNS